MTAAVRARARTRHAHECEGCGAAMACPFPGRAEACPVGGSVAGRHVPARCNRCGPPTEGGTR